jgi:RNA polymerase sigma-70 factor (ECF subfamily)
LPKEGVTPPQDGDLIQRARQGDQTALVEIYNSYQPSVFTYVFYRVCDQEIAEDLTAEVFTRMLANLPRYTSRGKPILAWLYTIARNLVIDHYRQSKRASHLPLEEDLVESEHDHPVKVAEDNLARECLSRALRRLTEEQRQVILLKFIECREISELVTMLGKNERAIRSLQHRALVALHRLMKKERCYEI